MMLVLLAVYPGDGMADWELRLTASVQHHKRASYNISLAWEKIKIQNLMYGFYWTCLAFLKHIYPSHLIFIFFRILKKKFFLTVLGFHCSAWAFSGCSKQGLLSSWDVWASLCSGFSCCRAQALGVQASVVVAHGLSCSVACGIFPDQGSNLCPLHWQVDS